MKLTEFIKRNKCKTIQDLQHHLQGKQIKIVARTSGHGFSFGNYTVNVVTTGSVTGINPYISCTLKEFPSIQAYTLYLADFDIASFSTIKEFESEILELRREIGEREKLITKYNQRIQFMEKNNIDEFSEDDFKILTALTYIEDNSLNKVEKAKVIGKMLKGEEVL